MNQQSYSSHFTLVGIGAFLLQASITAQECDQTSPIQCGQVVDRCLGQGQRECWSFTADGGELISIVLDSDDSASLTCPGGVNGFDSRFDLFGPNGEVVPVSPGEPRVGLHDIELPEAPGEYTISVRAVSNAAGSYRLGFEFLSPVESQCDVTEIQCGEVIEGCVEETGQDIVNFTADGGELVSIVLDTDTLEHAERCSNEVEVSASFEVRFDLFGPNGEVVPVSPGESRVGLHDVRLPEASGTYTLRIRGKLNASGVPETGGSYRLGFEFLSPVESRCDVTEIQCGEVIEGCIEETGQDIVNFTADGGELVSIVLDTDTLEHAERCSNEVEVSASFEVRFDLFGPNGEVVPVSPGESRVGLHDVRLPEASGTYTLRIRGKLNASGVPETGGSYRLGFEFLSPVESRCDVTEIQCGEVIEGCIEETGQDIVNFTADGGELVSIVLDTDSPDNAGCPGDTDDFEARFDLFDPSGELVEVSSTVGLHDVRLRTGKEATGTYTIRVRGQLNRDSRVPETGGSYRLGFEFLSPVESQCDVTLLSCGEVVENCLQETGQDVFNFSANGGERMLLDLETGEANCPGDTDGFRARFELFDPVGELVELPATDGSHEIDLPKNPPGTYTVRIRAQLARTTRIPEPGGSYTLAFGWLSPASKRCPRFVRGDCNGDGEAPGTPTDTLFMLNFLFQGGPTPPCLAACDANGDGNFSGKPTDAIYLLNFLFLGGATPPPPHPRCGFLSESRDQELGCETSACFLSQSP